MLHYLVIVSPILILSLVIIVRKRLAIRSMLKDDCARRAEIEERLRDELK